MRKLAAVVALLVLVAGTPASARGLNNLMAGVTGVVTFWADPVWSAVDPPESFDDMVGAPVTPHVLGFAQGTLLMAYRATMGVLDIALFPFWVFPTLSPAPRFNLAEYGEVEYE